MAEPLPPVAEREGQYRTTGGAYRVWHVQADGYEWLVRAVASATGGAWRVIADADNLSPAETYRLAEYVTRAAAYCKQRERERADG